MTFLVINEFGGWGRMILCILLLQSFGVMCLLDFFEQRSVVMLQNMLCVHLRQVRTYSDFSLSTFFQNVPVALSFRKTLESEAQMKTGHLFEDPVKCKMSISSLYFISLNILYSNLSLTTPAVV